MSNNTSSRKVSTEKVRILETSDDAPNEIDENADIDEEDGDLSITIEEDDDDDDINDDDNDDDDDIIDDDDMELNSDDGITPSIERVNAPTNRSSSKAAKSSVLQSTNTVVPPQFLASNAEEDESDDDIDIANMSGNITGDDEYDDDDDEDPETYLQKFESDINENLLLSHHPTEFTKNDSEISLLCQVTRNESNNVIDPLHKTIPFLTKYERTRVLGQRAKQINSGSKPYVVVPDHILDGYIIAQMELAQKRLPFIIERPIHGGGCEYWRVRDLEVL